MLIFIDSSVVDNGDQSTWDDDDDTVSALQHLASACHEGKHLVIAERGTLKKIAKSSRLSDNHKSIYVKLCNQATQQFRSYPSEVTKYIKIINPCSKPEVVSDSGQQIIKLPPRFFNDSELIQRTILLCENIDDAVLYETIAKVYLIWKNLNVEISCEQRGGGGNTISKEYTNIQKLKRRFCLCIVDSDKIAPHGNLGETAKSLSQAQSNSNCIMTQAFILNCREIENLIPNSILSELCLGKPERSDALKIIKNISRSAAEIRDFLDMKKGTQMKEIIKAKNPEIKSFWEVNISRIPNISSHIDKLCQESWQCRDNAGECKCKISLGFGENTLSNTIEYLRKKTPHSIAKIVDQSMCPEWEKIAQVVIDWCIAARSIRA